VQFNLPILIRRPSGFPGRQSSKANMRRSYPIFRDRRFEIKFHPPYAPRNLTEIVVVIPGKIATTGSRRHRRRHRRGRVDAKWVDPDRECIRTEAKSTVKNDNICILPLSSSSFARTTKRKRPSEEKNSICQICSIYYTFLLLFFLEIFKLTGGSAT
jgi:hypothetical protein